MSDVDLLYRPNVAAILIREDGRIFVAERIDRKGAWQFPQGGIDKGELPGEALVRELKEEICVGSELYSVEQERGGYRYLFPDGHVKWKKYRGQEQTYFLCRFTGSDEDICLETDEPEFGAYRWILPEEFDLEWVPEFKKDVYLRVLGDFFGWD
jgi:putative (di)nucleoside polyphosphate hydrolase